MPPSPYEPAPVTIGEKWAHGRPCPATDRFSRALLYLRQLDKDAADRVEHHAAAYVTVLHQNPDDVQADERVWEYLQEVYTLIEEHAEAYTYFGACREGGPGVGCWPDWDRVQDALANGDLLTADTVLAEDSHTINSPRDLREGALIFAGDAAQNTGTLWQVVEVAGDRVTLRRCWEE